MKESFIKKHLLATIVLTIIAVLIVVGLVFLIKLKKKNNRAYVQPVSDINMNYMLSNDTGDGTIKDNATQNVVVSTADTIEEIYVSEGQEVKKGDPLLSYDTQALKLSLEEEKLSVDSAKQTLQAEEDRLTRFQNMDPLTQEDIMVITANRMATLQRYDEDYNAKMKEEEEAAEKTWEQTKAEEERQAARKAYDDAKASALATAKETEMPEAMKKAEAAGATFSEADWTAGWETSYAEENPYVEPEFDQAAWEAAYKEQVPYKEPEEAEIKPWDPNYYTDEEKQKMIADQQVVVKKAKSTVRDAEIQLEQAQNKLKNATVTASMDGMVTKIGDKDHLPNDGSAFMIVSSAAGVAVSGGISEFRLDKVKVGDRITVNDWMTGSMSEAEIVDISPYPAAEGTFYAGNGNPNTSFYPYTAVLDNPNGFNAGDGVSISWMSATENPDTIVLEKVYVRGDDEGSYVLVAEDGKLVKRRVTVEELESDSSYLHVLDGLNQDDLIAFPYGRTGFEGNITTEEYPTGIMNMFGI